MCPVSPSCLPGVGTVLELVAETRKREALLWFGGCKALIFFWQSVGRAAAEQRENPGVRSGPAGRDTDIVTASQCLGKGIGMSQEKKVDVGLQRTIIGTAALSV